MKINLLNIIKKISETPIEELARKSLIGFKHYIQNYPTLIILQTVSACNLKCHHCFLNNYGREIKFGQSSIMNLEKFKEFVPKLIKVIKNAQYFQFSTFEPTLNKHLFDMMDIILDVNYKIQFPILTNGMLTDEAYLRKLRKYPISEFTVSLDGSKKETVERFKTGSNFEKIIETINLVVKLGFQVNTVFVLHKNNFKELPEYIDFVNELGVKKIFINNILSFSKEFENWHLYRKEGNPEIEKIFEIAKDKVEQNKQSIYLPLLRPEELGCTACESLFININGDVAPCDFLAVDTPFFYFGAMKQSNSLIFGNILETEAFEIYNSKKFREFRNMHRKGIIPEICSHCIDAYGLFCSNRKKYGV